VWSSRNAAVSPPPRWLGEAELEATEARIRQTTIEYFPRVTLRAQYTRLSPVAADFGSGALVGARAPGLLSTGPCPPPAAGTCVLDSSGQPVGAAAFQIESIQDNYSLTGSITVPLSDYVFRLPDAAAAAKAARTAAGLNVGAERRRIQSEGRLIYYGWVGAVGQVTVAQKSLERTRARLKDADAAFALGTISKADLMRLQALVANTELAVKEAETLRDLRARQLGILMGEPDRTAVREVGEDVLAPASGRVRGSLAALSAEALKKRIELAALTQHGRALRRGADAVQARGLPRLEALADVTVANPNPRYFPPAQQWNATWSAGVAATCPLPRRSSKPTRACSKRSAQPWSTPFVRKSLPPIWIAKRRWSPSKLRAAPRARLPRRIVSQRISIA
jgi:outer membrane protein